MSGRAWRLVMLLPDYACNAWAGLVRPRLGGPARVVQAVIRSGDELLLAVRRDLRGWELPGGNAVEGESDTEALRREVREETGFEVEVGRLVGEYHRSGFRPHVALVHECRVVAGQLAPSAETPVVRWFRTDALPDTLFPWYRDPILDALARRSETVVRHEHQGLDAVLAGMRIDLRMRLGGE